MVVIGSAKRAQRGTSMRGRALSALGVVCRAPKGGGQHDLPWLAQSVRVAALHMQWQARLALTVQLVSSHYASEPVNVRRVALAGTTQMKARRVANNATVAHFRLQARNYAIRAPLVAAHAARQAVRFVLRAIMACILCVWRVLVGYRTHAHVELAK